MLKKKVNKTEGEKVVKKVTVRLEDDFHKKLKIYCVQNGCTLQDYIINATKSKLDKI